MKTLPIALMVALMFFLSNSAVSGGGERDATKEQIATVCREFDTVFHNTEYEKAEGILKSGLSKYGQQADLLYRYVDLMIHFGDVAGEEQKKAYYQRAIEYADAAVKADQKCASAHAAVAASAGAMGLFAGGEEKVKIAHLVRDELERALALDPDCYLAHTVYGTYHREVADLSWVERQLAKVLFGGVPEGSYEKSVDHLKKAIALEPGILRNYYELGRTYDAMDEEAAAARAFKRALTMKNTARKDTERKKIMREYIDDM